MAKVEIYTTATCPYCVLARRLLKRKNVAFEELPIDKDTKRQREMMKRSRRNTVPQIFIDGKHIGGYDDLAELDADDGLDPLLNA